MKKSIFILTVVLSLIFLMSCTQFVLPKEESVQVKVLLTDKPVKDLEKLDVYITSFKYHYVTDENDEGIWSEEIPVATQVDILSLAGTEAELLNIEIPKDATLTSIILKIQQATVTVDGVEKPVELKKNEVLISNVDIQITDSGELVLDFDVARSIHYKPANDTYMLTPVLKPTFRRHNEEKYLVKGMITENGEPYQGAVVTLLPSDESTILRMSISNKDGAFCLGKHENGTYVIKVYKSIDIPDEEEELTLPETEDASKIIEIKDQDITNILFEF